MPGDLWSLIGAHRRKSSTNRAGARRTEVTQMSSTSPAVGRALDVLLYLAGKPGPVSGAAVARDLKIPRSSTYHLLDVLIARGFVVHFPDQRTYGLGMAAFEIGSAYLRHEPLEMLARPVLRRLVAQVGETAHLGVLHGAESLYLLKERALFPSARGFVDRTGLGPASLPELRRVLTAERQQRWSEEIGLVTAGLQSVAACAFDHSGRPCAAISVTWRKDHTGSSHPDLVRAVRVAAQQLTWALSGHGPEGWFEAAAV